MIAGGQQHFRSPWLRCVSHWRDLAQEFPRFEGLDGAEPMPTPSCVAGYLTLLDMLAKQASSSSDRGELDKCGMLLDVRRVVIAACYSSEEARDPANSNYQDWSLHSSHRAILNRRLEAALADSEELRRANGKLKRVADGLQVQLRALISQTSRLEAELLVSQCDTKDVALREAAVRKKLHHSVHLHTESSDETKLQRMQDKVDTAEAAAEAAAKTVAEEIRTREMLGELLEEGRERERRMAAELESLKTILDTRSRDRK